MFHTRNCDQNSSSIQFLSGKQNQNPHGFNWIVNPMIVYRPMW